MYKKKTKKKNYLNNLYRTKKIPLLFFCLYDFTKYLLRSPLKNCFKKRTFSCPLRTKNTLLKEKEFYYLF